MIHKTDYQNNVARTLAGVAAVAAVGAAAYTIHKIHAWSKDKYATELWLHGCCGRGVIIKKGSEPHTYQVRTNFRLFDDVPQTEIGSDMEQEPEMELDISDVISGDET